MLKLSLRGRFTHIRNFQHMLNFPILKQPKHIKSKKAIIIIVGIIASAIFDFMSFTLKGSESAISKGHVFLSIFLLVLYFSQRVIESSYDTYRSLQNDTFNQLYSIETTQIIMDLCKQTRGKVYKKEGNQETLMEHPEILQKTKTYLDSVWNFWWKLPVVISEVLILVSMIATTIIVEARDSDIYQTIFIMSMLVVCIIIYFILGYKRIKLMKSFRKKKRDAEAKEDVLYTEIKNIEFISESDFEYHAQRFRNLLFSRRELIKSENLKLNKVFIKRSLIASGFMVVILLYKVFTSAVIDTNVILSVVAISSVYSTILSKIGSIISKFESIADNVIDITTLNEDFKSIYDVYTEEVSKEFISSTVQSVSVGKFSATQDQKKAYLLNNESSFVLNKGDYVLVSGPTGCGKSTLLLLLTGKLRIPESPISFSNGKKGYLKSISYQTDKALANNFVLNEIILSDDPDTTDKKKLLEILQGLRLYTVFLSKAKAELGLSFDSMSTDEIVFEVLKTCKTDQFSSGQKQRIALAKLFYTMDESYQVIALDEAFNRLDDVIAKQCIDFVFEYTQRDTKRILLLATHQVNLVQPICNKEISFTQDDLNVSHMEVSNIQ